MLIAVMRLPLFYKVFVTFFIASSVSIVLFAASARWYIEKTFLSYLGTRQVETLVSIAESAAARYSPAGQWQELSGNPQAWRRILRGSRLPPRELLPPRPVFPAAPPPFPVPGRRTTLFDIHGRAVVGTLAFDDNLIKVPVIVEGEQAGWVGAAPIRRPTAPSDIDLLQRLGRLLLIGAAIALLLSALGAWLTARRLTGPIKQIGDGARDLAAGKFDTRLPKIGRDEIGQLADDFNILAKALEENEQSRRRWVADISHELRTPLAIMRGEIEAVQDGIRPFDHRLLSSVEQEATRLNVLVDDLHTLARADIGSLDYSFETCSLSAIALEEAERYRSRLAQAGLELETAIAADIRILGDQHQLRQVLENLLENCVRYAGKPGQVRVSLSPDSPQLSLVVEDSGPGVAAPEQARLFDPLYRLEHSRNRTTGGSGLGLAICKRIAEAHGGDIAATSSRLGGLAISLTLPATN